MKGPLANFDTPSGDLGMYLSDAEFAVGIDGAKPEQTEILTIADFDALMAERKPGFVMFGFYGYPRRGVAAEKARRLVEKLLRQYARGEAGKWR
jgi:hypothetical protein